MSKASFGRSTNFDHFRRLARLLLSGVWGLIFLPLAAAPAAANPYLSKSGEPPVTVYVATCATSGGFIHIYTALDQNLFSKYGLSVKHVVIRTATNINLAALATDEIHFLY